jgi:competence protein ComEC
VHPRRHPYHVALGALVVGLLLSEAPQWWAAAGAGVALLSLAVARAPALGIVAAALLIAGTAVGGWRLAAIDAPSLRLHAGERLEARAWLVERPRPSLFGSSAELRLVSGPGRGARVLARASGSMRWPRGGEPGTAVLVSGLLERPKRSRRSDFDWPAYLRRRGIHLELSLERLDAGGAPRGGVAGDVDSLRRRAERGLAAGLGGENGPLAAGMVLGEDQRISSETKDDFQRSGLSHLLAVSGQNVMLLGALALPLLSLAGLGVRSRLAGVGALVALYVPLAGAGASLQRAGVMGAAGLAAIAAGRPASRWYALLLAAAATLALNPRVAGDPGWQLSFAAVIGIALLVPGIRRGLGWLPGALAEGAAITTAAVLATAPLLAHHFGSVQLVALPANLLALPAVAPIMWLGMLQAALGASGGAALAPAAGLGALNGLLLDYLRLVARWFGDAPHGQAALALRSPLSVVAAYAGIAARVLCVRRAARARLGRGLAAVAAPPPRVARGNGGGRAVPRRLARHGAGRPAAAAPGVVPRRRPG